MKGLPRSHSRGAPQAQPIMKQVLRGKATITVAGATGVGFGTTALAGLPEGNILFLGAVGYVQAATTSEDVEADWEGDFGVGTTGASDGTITGTDVDILPSTAFMAATAGVSPMTRTTSATQSIIDNTNGTTNINLSILVDDADIDADGVEFEVTYTICLSYIMMLDD